MVPCLLLHVQSQNQDPNPVLLLYALCSGSHSHIDQFLLCWCALLFPNGHPKKKVSLKCLNTSVTHEVAPLEDLGLRLQHMGTRFSTILFGGPPGLRMKHLAVGLLED